MFASTTISHVHEHSHKVTHLKFNSNGSALASGSEDNTARVWRITSGGLLAPTLNLAGHKASVTQLAWSHNDHELATCSEDKTVRLWDTRAKVCSASLETKGELINICWKPGSEIIVVGDKKDALSWIDVRTRKVLNEFHIGKETNEFGYDISAQLFCTTTGDGCLDIYAGEIGSLEKVLGLQAHSARSLSLAFSPDGKRLAIGSMDALVSVWDSSEFICERTLARFEYLVRSVSFSHDSNYLASGSEDDFVDIAFADTGEVAHRLELTGQTNCVEWHPKSNILAIANCTSETPGGICLFTKK